jgi:hypothetical protein
MSEEYYDGRETPEEAVDAAEGCCFLASIIVLFAVIIVMALTIAEAAGWIP